MRKKGLNPKSLIALVIVAIGSLVIALLCKMYLFEGMRLSMLLFWVVYLVLASVGAFLVGRFLNKGGR